MESTDVDDPQRLATLSLDIKYAFRQPPLKTVRGSLVKLTCTVAQSAVLPPPELEDPRALIQKLLGQGGYVPSDSSLFALNFPPTSQYITARPSLSWPRNALGIM
jgi:hypothetical protein